MRAVILNFTGRRENWGCQATSYNLYRFLQTLSPGSGFDSIEIVPFPPGSLLDKYEQSRFGDRLRAIFANPNPSEADLAWLERRVLARFGPMVERVKRADVVFFQGEGAIGPSRFFRSTLLFGLPVIAARLYGKPLISLNQTVYASQEDDADCLVNILSGFHFNAVRETASLDWCVRNGLTNTALHPDLAFCDMFAPVSDSASRHPYFCVTGSAALETYDLTAYSRQIADLAEQLGTRVTALSSRSQESGFLAELGRQIGENLTIVSSQTHPNYRDILPIIAGSAFVLGGRYHTSISALSQGTPVILTPSNSHKSQGLADLLGLTLPVIQPGGGADLSVVGQEIFEARDAKRSEIRQALFRVESNLAAFRETLSDALSKVGMERSKDVSNTPLRQAFTSQGLVWRHDGVPKGAAKLLSQISRSHNLAAFDWKDLAA